MRAGLKTKKVRAGWAFKLGKMVGGIGIEPMTPPV